jgi:pyruvate-formate lyase-activating enzyme
MLYADERGKIYDHPHLEMTGREGDTVFRLAEEDLLPMPEGAKLFTMPGRSPAGWDPEAGGLVILESVESISSPQAVSAFLPPAYLRTYLPATRPANEPPALPLWAYAPVGWRDGRFWVTGLRVDPSTHWEAGAYDDRELLPRVRARMKGCENRLLRHLERCATEYHCLAAKNLFYRRWECPLPVSPVCNADCVGCLSLQPEGKVPASHERLSFQPTAEEILEIAVPHLESAPEAVVSFGQGCEGEPLLQSSFLEGVLRAIRRETSRGVIHINTNASHSDSVARLAAAGLDSIRVSLNSAQEEYYGRYYRPRGYGLRNVARSLRTAVQAGLFTSINYLTFPGFTDRRSECDHLLALLRETGLHMIQWKNLNIDPDLYESLIGKSGEERLGMRRMVEEVRAAFPQVEFGYFNRPRAGRPGPAGQAAGGRSLNRPRAETISRPRREERDPSRGLRTNTR